MEFPDISKIPYMRGIGGFAFLGMAFAPPFILFYFTEPKIFMSMEIIRLFILCLGAGITTTCFGLTMSYAVIRPNSPGAREGLVKNVPMLSIGVSIFAYFLIFCWAQIPDNLLINFFKPKPTFGLAILYVISLIIVFHFILRLTYDLFWKQENKGPLKNRP